jgi:hypothetical protein
MTAKRFIYCGCFYDAATDRFTIESKDANHIYRRHNMNRNDRFAKILLFPEPPRQSNVMRRAV